MTDLARELGKLAGPAVGPAPLRLPLPARRQRHPADGRGAGPPLPRHPVPARQPQGAARDAPPGQRRQGARAHPQLARRSSPTSPSARASSSASPARPRRISQYLLDWLEEAQLDRVGAFSSSRSRAPPPTPCPTRCPRRSRRSATPRIMAADRAHLAPRSSRPRSADHRRADRRGRRRDRRRHRPLQGRRARDRRRGPPARRRRPQARRHRPRSLIEDADEHDLFGVPALKHFVSKRR